METYTISDQEFVGIFTFIQTLIEKDKNLKDANTYASGTFDKNRLLFEIKSDDKNSESVAVIYLMDYFKSKDITIRRVKNGIAFINIQIENLKKLVNENSEV